MGKPGPTSDRSCSGALSRHIVHRVAVYSGHGSAANYDNVLPKMAKQDFAFSASTNTRFLDWKAAQLAYYNHPNNHSRDRCPQLWSTDLENNPLFGHECHAMRMCPNGGCKQCGGLGVRKDGKIIYNGEGYCANDDSGKPHQCFPMSMKPCTAPHAVRYAWDFSTPGAYVSMVCPGICPPWKVAEHTAFWYYAKAWPDTHPLEACGGGQKSGYRCRAWPTDCDNAAANVGDSC